MHCERFGRQNQNKQSTFKSRGLGTTVVQEAPDERLQPAGLGSLRLNTLWGPRAGGGCWEDLPVTLLSLTSCRAVSVGDLDSS